MRRLTQFAVHRPRVALGAWLVVVAMLALVGRGVDAQLQPTDLGVEGSSSARAAALVDAQFGESATIPVLLTGPSRDVRSQGKRLAERLEGERGVSVVSPWNAGDRRGARRGAAAPCAPPPTG